MRARAVHDVSQLPTYGFGSTSPIWWGTLAFVAEMDMGGVRCVLDGAR